MPDFETLFAVRVKRDVGERLRELAAREGNTQTGVLRRVISVGLETIDARERLVATEERMSES